MAYSAPLSWCVIQPDAVSHAALLAHRLRTVAVSSGQALLPPGAVVVNVGRGELIDEAAMWAALNEDGGRRLAFGSDVWWQEPKTAPPHPSV